MVSPKIVQVAERARLAPHLPSPTHTEEDEEPSHSSCHPLDACVALIHGTDRRAGYGEMLLLVAFG